ncbi:MAG: CoA pyrophosphatase [Winogradskyella sp.]|uniref:NUDIX hydrolase n=1 Tax=Winogradskyella sp. TaxID=1883156 RepID=UPI000F41AB2B|nr:CoA pyrophosphatase [Winogradskyella sp.]RNC80220.1 MAG: CoA pyrophosphatase [Winogradskyella sp.]
MNFSTFLDSVVNIKHLPLLGEEAHAKLSPPFRLQLAEKYKEKRKTASKAGVMALFYPSTKNETMLVLILRKSYKGVHSAQVGFPGGKVEESDADFKETALRETEEEIGIPITQVEVLKELSPLYIPPSNFMVYPFFGVSKTELNFVKQEEEVESIIEVSLNDLLNDINIITKKVSTSYNVKVEVPAFKLNGHVVWGATAMMLSEIKVLLKDVL